jgi:starch-binding outer membrane protein, SusD/RagB family
MRLKLRTIGLITCCIALLQCTKLDEPFLGDLTAAQVARDSANTAALLQGVYNAQSNLFTTHLVIFPLNEVTTDAAIMPTRGADWDDNGAWRVLHQHRWNALSAKLLECFNGLNGIVFASTDLLRFNATVSEKAQARFLRAWAMYWILDMFDQVPYRDPGEEIIQAARVRQGLDAYTYIVEELEAILSTLPDGPPQQANKDAARSLLMKCYLNRAVYANRANPVFRLEDMNKVIQLADMIINSNRYQISDGYFDNFSPLNKLISKELIFAQEDLRTPDNVLWIAALGSQHPNQPPFGLNGFSTLSNFYGRFEPRDKRRSAVYDYPDAPPNPGRVNNAGFLIGQQYSIFSGDSLFDSDGTPLVFQPEVRILETGRNQRLTGIRANKYLIDWLQIGSPRNNMVFFRFPDVLLMKAEAILRGGTPTAAGVYGNSARDIVNALRTHPSRDASSLSNVNLETMLDERGRELWWEGWRRQDMIRFGQYLMPFQEKDYTSDPKYLVFAIPAQQLSVNPNLKQNPGY